MKCEETKPFCKKCTSTGRKCDGYLAIPSSSSKSFLALPISETQFVGNDLERRSFDFFCQRTVVDLAGLFDPTFWTRVVLQTTHHEPAIKHAVIALGALHENYNNGVRKGESAFAIQQYTKAIGSLVKPIQEKGILAVDVALITCVLFVCFEVGPRSPNYVLISDNRVDNERKPRHGNISYRRLVSIVLTGRITDPQD